MQPIKTYAVKVAGYTPVLYSARSRGRARWRAYCDYRIVGTLSFGEFLALSTIYRIADPPGTGDLILVDGRPATRVISRTNSHYVYFMRADSDAILCSHPLDVTTLAGRDQ